MSRSKMIVTCDKCGKQHNSKSKNVVWNAETLGWDCVKCNIVHAVFTITELRRMLETMEQNNKTAIVYSGHVSKGQWNKGRKLEQ